VNQRTIFDRSDTRRAAHEAIEPTARTQRATVLAAIRAAGRRGLTDSEGMLTTGFLVNSYTPRRRELVQAGLVLDSGQTRPSHHGTHRDRIVWVTCDAPAVAATSGHTSPAAGVTCDKCGCQRYRDFPIHNGQSVRCDCARCGRFISFPVWYGKQIDHA